MISHFMLPLLHRHKQGWADENWGIGSGDDADEEREGEMLGDFGADDIEYDEGDNRRERSVDGTNEGLLNAFPHNGVKMFLVAEFSRYF